MPRPARRKRKAADRMLSKDAYELLHPDLVMSTAEKQAWYRNTDTSRATDFEENYALAKTPYVSHEDATQAAQKATYGKVFSDKVARESDLNRLIASAADPVPNPNYGRYRNLFTQDSIKLEGAQQPAVLQLPNTSPAGLVSLALAAELMQGLVPNDVPQNEKLI